ncbi:MAG: metallophosphoesterase [Candidatus Moranbacteria bacterium]|nr:metallophosphoesterase [Candidatus Moranbacteria bacterium]
MKEEIIVFSDVHFAKIWDDIDKLLGDKLDMLNPNRELRRIVKIINSSTNAVAVINNGDSVDYFFADYFGNKLTGSRETNWDLFNSIVAKIKKQYYEIPGNHDYRSLGYNFDLYGLKHINISDHNRKKFAKLIGHNKFRWLKEWTTLSVNEKKFDPLKKFNGFKKPVEKDFGKFHCIFLNTGSDAIVRFKNIFKYIKKVFTKSTLKQIVLKNNWRGLVSCVNDGIKKKDLDFINEALEKNHHREFYFFLHTPIINSRKSHPDKIYQLKMEGFLGSIAKQNLDYEVVLNGGGMFLEILTDKNYLKKNFIIVASHIHNAKYFLIHKETLVAKEVTLGELNKEKNNPAYIKHLTTLSLGALDFCPENRHTGYLKISADGFREVVLNKF